MAVVVNVQSKCKTKQDRQRKHDVKLRRIRATIVVVEKL